MSFICSKDCSTLRAMPEELRQKWDGLTPLRLRAVKQTKIYTYYHSKY